MSSARTPGQQDQEKQLAAQAALGWVRSGMALGLGSGTTMGYFIRFLGDLLRTGNFKIDAVASSRECEAAALAARIPLILPRRGLRLDLVVDGADEISPELDLLKGRGGAMLREKALAQASRYFLVIADSSKRVQRLGNAPVSVEVVPFTQPWVADRIEEMGGRPVLRMDANVPDKPYCTDQQNHVLDCHFERLENPAGLGERLERIPGVVGHGLFLGCAQAALVAESSEVFVYLPNRTSVRLADFSIPFLRIS